MLQWQLKDLPSSPTFKGEIVQVADHPDSVDADDEPVHLFLAEDDFGRLHVFLPMFRKIDYGLMWLEVRGPMKLNESIKRWKPTDRRLAAHGLVRWRVTGSNLDPKMIPRTAG